MLVETSNRAHVANAAAAQLPKSPKTKAFEGVVMYYGYRFYDPETGRWPSKDPIEENGGLNLYGFLGNDSVGWIDFMGLADINVSIERFYLRLETIGIFKATPSDEEVLKCCGTVLGTTLELKKGKYSLVPDPEYTDDVKDYPIPEGTHDGDYSKSTKTSLNARADANNKWINKWNSENQFQHGLYPYFKGREGTHNIDILNSKFESTRIHTGVSSQYSRGCPIIGPCNPKFGPVDINKYPELNGKKANIHYWEEWESRAKALEIANLIECVKKKIGKEPKITVTITGK